MSSIQNKMKIEVIYKKKSFRTDFSTKFLDGSKRLILSPQYCF